MGRRTRNHNAIKPLSNRHSLSKMTMKDENLGRKSTKKGGKKRNPLFPWKIVEMYQEARWNRLASEINCSRISLMASAYSRKKGALATNGLGGRREKNDLLKPASPNQENINGIEKKGKKREKVGRR